MKQLSLLTQSQKTTKFGLAVFTSKVLSVLAVSLSWKPRQNDLFTIAIYNNFNKAAKVSLV